MIPDLVAALEQGLRAHMEKDTWGKEKMHVSDLAVILPDELGAKCARSIYHRINGHERKEESVGSMLMLENGHSVHHRLPDYMANALGEQGWTITGIESPVGDHFPEWMDGTLDIRLEHHETGQKVVVDIKTKDSKAFRHLTKPQEVHVLQVQGYLKAEDADYGLIFYVDRGGTETPVVFVVHRDDEAVNTGVEMLDAIRQRTEPPRRMAPVVKLLKNKGPNAIKLSLPWQCNYCPFLDKSCDGALRPELRDVIVGYTDGETVTVKPQYEELTPAILRLMEG